MNRIKQGFLTFITGLLIIFSTPSFAITAGELLDEKDSKYISRYLAGMIGMLAYMEYVKGNDKRGACLNNWYYRTEGSIEKMNAYLEKYPDKAPEGIMIVLAKRACPLVEKKN